MSNDVLMSHEKFIKKSELAFRDLFEAAKLRDELHFALSLSPEFRPYHFNTSIEADKAFDQYINFLNNNDYPELRPRIALAFYCHLAEASGYWEVVKNMLCVSNGELYNVAPFHEFVKKHKTSGELIAPNANKVLKSIVGFANELGHYNLAEVFRDAFHPDIRNGFAHADYVLFNSGIALKNRYGKEQIISWEELNLLLNKGICFYGCLRDIVREYIRSYSSPKVVQGRLHKEPISKWTIHYNLENGSFTISTP